MMQNTVRMVARRSGHTGLAPRPPVPFRRALVADVLHRFELWTLLECHAVGRAARSGNRDVRTVRAVFPELNGELESICARHIRQPIHRPGTLWLLQCQHRQILSCIEAGCADEAVLHTRAHLHLIRDQLVAALNASGVQ